MRIARLAVEHAARAVGIRAHAFHGGCKLQDRGDTSPYGVAAKDDQGLARLFVPGMGLVDMPPMASYTHNGEVGGHPITEDEAKRLMRAGVGRMTKEAALSLKGSAPTIPVEM